MFHIIVAHCKNHGIGYQNKLPWKTIKKDMAKFKQLTIGNGNNAIIMGKNTFQSTGFLKHRHNLVLSSSLNLSDTIDSYQLESFSNIQELLKYVQTQNYDKVWIIGGQQIYDLFLKKNLISEIYVTYIDDLYECDTFMPHISPEYMLYHQVELFDKNEHNKPIYNILYKKINMKDRMYYKKKDVCQLLKIHYDDSPNLYYTIKTKEGREIQTNIDNLSFIL